MKYIGVDKLKAEIEKRAKFHDDAIKACVGLNDIAITHSAGWKEDTELLAIISSLQQELSEVDLEKEIDREWEKCNPTDEGMGVETANIHIEAFDMITRHFYELGRTEGIKGNLEEIPSNVDLEKELQAFLCNYDYEFDDDPVPFDIATHFYELGLNARKAE